MYGRSTVAPQLAQPSTLPSFVFLLSWAEAQGTLESETRAPYVNLYRVELCHDSCLDCV